MEEAKETLRALVERIVLTPSVEGAGLDLPLEGDLAGLQRLAAGAKGTNTDKAPDVSSETFEKNDELGILAGAGKRRILPALAGLRSRYPDIELELHADDSKSDFAAEAINLSFRTGLADKERFISAAVPSAQRAPFASPAFAEKSPCLSRPARQFDGACICSCPCRARNGPAPVLADRGAFSRAPDP
ncbi:hypothetical protein J4729_13000 [Leisingera sp. HS039]|uniref:LysR substrate-binding domain-containing protein n=1 Tax=unclassified Leisingera TaxID=2614906 RepID=UPI001070F92F|nr:MULTISPECIES: LysR substrate-binding domain-containing protein [unclassified Leisingera]MBQ4825461.1 hypothetical protein [Leisingera sp. HS039]QBR37812.1 hypothetical protein ETW23_18490 [Leisingera sp. NJS201]